jgi:hypothetical protein
VTGPADAGTLPDMNRLPHSFVLVACLWLSSSPDATALVRPSTPSCFRVDMPPVGDSAEVQVLPETPEYSAFLVETPAGPFILFCRNNPMDRTDPYGLQDLLLHEVRTGTAKMDEPAKAAKALSLKLHYEREPNITRMRLGDKTTPGTTGLGPGSIYVYVGHGEAPPPAIAAHGSPPKGSGFAAMKTRGLLFTAKVTAYPATLLGTDLQTANPPLVTMLACCNATDIGKVLVQTGLPIVILGGDDMTEGTGTTSSGAGAVAAVLAALGKGRTLADAVEAGNEVIRTTNARTGSDLRQFQLMVDRRNPTFKDVDVAKLTFAQLQQMQSPKP